MIDDPPSFPFKRRPPHSTSELALEQIANHLLARDIRRLPQRREIQRAGQAVGEAKEEHGRDPAARVLEREAGLGHLVLLDVAAAQVVHAAGRVDFRLVLAGHVGHLRAGQDVEVVVGGVAAAVAFCADGGAEDDEIFSYTYKVLANARQIKSVLIKLTGVKNVHAAHGTARIVKHPVLVEIHISRHLFVELVDNVLDNAPRVVAVLGDAPLRQIVQVVRLKDVEAVQVLVDHVDDGCQQRREEA